MFIFVCTFNNYIPRVSLSQVVDEFGGKGNVLNFNVGDGVKFALPNVFWTRLTSKYGTVSLYVVLLNCCHCIMLTGLH